MKLKVLAIVLLLVVGGAALFVATGGLPKSEAAAVTYLTAPATVTDVSDDIAATGSIAASTGWDLAFGAPPTTSGTTAASSSSSSSGGATSTDSDSWTVAEIKVKVGDTVAPKEVLATATNSTLEADIEAARNSRATANIQLVQAKEAFAAATTTDTIRQTRVQVLQAENSYAQAATTLRDLQAAAVYHTLVAPAAGKVTAMNLTVGADAPSGAAISLDAASYQVTADVVETDISKMAVGQVADVTVSAINADVAGKVFAIAPTAETSSSSNSVVNYAVTIDLTSPTAEMRSGMTADITITTASAPNVLAVPTAAIRGSSGNYSVLVLVNGAPQVTPVTVGLMTSSLVEVKSGLNQGDEVVIGTSSTQRTTTGTGGFGGGGFGGAGGFVVPGGRNVKAGN